MNILEFFWQDDYIFLNVVCNVKNRRVTQLNFGSMQHNINFLKASDPSCPKLPQLTVGKLLLDSDSSPSGFVNTPQLQCFYGSLSTPLHTKFIDVTRIECELTPQHTHTPKKYPLLLSFSQYNQEKHMLRVDHYVGLTRPSTVRARFNNKLNVIKVMFGFNVL